MQSLESNFLVPTGTLIVLLTLLTILMLFGALVAWLLRLLVGRSGTAPQGETGNDTSRR